MHNTKYSDYLLNSKQGNESLQGVINESIDLKDILEVEVSSLREKLARSKAGAWHFSEQNRENTELWVAMETVHIEKMTMAQVSRDL